MGGFGWLAIDGNEAGIAKGLGDAAARAETAGLQKQIETHGCRRNEVGQDQKGLGKIFKNLPLPLCSLPAGRLPDPTSVASAVTSSFIFSNGKTPAV